MWNYCFLINEYSLSGNIYLPFEVCGLVYTYFSIFLVFLSWKIGFITSLRLTVLKIFYIFILFYSFSFSFCLLLLLFLVLQEEVGANFDSRIDWIVNSKADLFPKRLWYFHFISFDFSLGHDPLIALLFYKSDNQKRCFT